MNISPTMNAIISRALILTLIGASACGAPPSDWTVDSDEPVTTASAAPALPTWREASPRPLEAASGEVVAVILDHPTDDLQVEVGGHKVLAVRYDTFTWMMVLPLVEEPGSATVTLSGSGIDGLMFDAWLDEPHRSPEQDARTVLENLAEVTFAVADAVGGHEGGSLRAEAAALKEGLSSIGVVETQRLAEIVAASRVLGHAGEIETPGTDTGGTRTVKQGLLGLSVGCAVSALKALFSAVRNANAAPSLSCTLMGVAGTPTLGTGRVVEGSSFTVTCTASDPGEGIAQLSLAAVGDAGATFTGPAFTITTGTMIVPAAPRGVETQTLSFTVNLGVTGHVRPLQFDVTATDAPSVTLARTSVRSFAIRVNEIVAPVVKVFSVDRAQVPVGGSFQVEMALADPMTTGAKGRPSGVVGASFVHSTNIFLAMGPHLGIGRRDVVVPLFPGSLAAGSLPTLSNTLGNLEYVRTIEGRCTKAGTAVIGVSVDDADGNSGTGRVEFECVAAVPVLPDRQCGMSDDCNQNEHCVLSAPASDPVCRACADAGCALDAERYIVAEAVVQLSDGDTACTDEQPQPTPAVTNELASALHAVATEYCRGTAHVTLVDGPQLTGCTQLGESTASAVWVAGGYWACD